MPYLPTRAMDQLDQGQWSHRRSSGSREDCERASGVFPGMDILRSCSRLRLVKWDHPRHHQMHPRRCQVAPQRVKVLAAELPLFLMRFLNLRLYPKAAATPRAGRGPGTDVDDGVGGWTAANVKTPTVRE